MRQEYRRKFEMALFLSRWMTAVHAERLVLDFHVALTTSVFVFLALLTLLTLPQ